MYKFTQSVANFPSISSLCSPFFFFLSLAFTKVLGGTTQQLPLNLFLPVHLSSQQSCFSSAWHLHLSWLISCSGASWDSSSCCQIFVLGDQLIWSWVHAPIHTHTHTHTHTHVYTCRVIGAQVGFCVCCSVYLCGWVIAKLLILVCIFHSLDRCIDHLVKLQRIKGTTMFTAGVQLLCLQMNGWVRRWREECSGKKKQHCHFLSIFQELAELALAHFGFVQEHCVNEIYCSAKSILIETNPCFTCGQCKFHFLEHLYCPFIYFPVSSLLSLPLMRSSVPLPHKLKPFRWITSP